MAKNDYDCRVCGEKFSPKLKEELIEHLRDHHAEGATEMDMSEAQLEDLESHPEL